MHLACDRGASPRELFASVFGMALFSDSFSIGVSYGSFCCGSSSTTASALSSMLSLVFRIHVWPDVYGAHLYDLIYETGERGAFFGWKR